MLFNVFEFLIEGEINTYLLKCAQIFQASVNFPKYLKIYLCVQKLISTMKKFKISSLSLYYLLLLARILTRSHLQLAYYFIKILCPKTTLNNKIFWQICSHFQAPSFFNSMLRINLSTNNVSSLQRPTQVTYFQWSSVLMRQQFHQWPSLRGSYDFSACA